MNKYGIITAETTYIPGDERSRTNPGHGYPESYQTQTVLKTYDDETKWKAAIESYANPKYGMPKVFTAIVYQVVEITTAVQVKVNNQPL